MVVNMESRYIHFYTQAYTHMRECMCVCERERERMEERERGRGRGKDMLIICTCMTLLSVPDNVRTVHLILHFSC